MSLTLVYEECKGCVAHQVMTDSYCQGARLNREWLIEAHLEADFHHKMILPRNSLRRVLIIIHSPLSAVVMALSVSVGDFIAVAKVIKTIISSLKQSTRAPNEYQELERELFGLQMALYEIEHLEVHPSRQPAANAIKCAALSCKHVLVEFESKLSKYKEPLGHDRALARFNFNSVSKKLQWEFQIANEVSKLRVYIAAHVGSLNMRLLTLGLWVHG